MRRYIRDNWLISFVTVVLIIVLLVYRCVDLEVSPSTNEDNRDLITEAQESGSDGQRIGSAPALVQVSKLAVTGTPTNTPTSTPSPTMTSTPTRTPSPTMTMTPTPTPRLFKAYAPLMLKQPTPTPRPPSIKVLANELNVRRGPGTQYKVLYTVHKGDILIVQSKNIEFRSSPWFLIEVRLDGVQEWITGSTKYVEHYNTDNLSYRDY
jgi:hypothetical protein